jgi:YD repeat-containing protein
MKNILNILLLTLLVSCSKDDATTEPTTNPADAVYRIKQKIFAGNGITVNYEYTPQNKINKITYPDGRFEKYNYNSQGLLLSFQVGGNAPGGPSNYSTNFLYDATGARTETIATYLNDAGQIAGKQKITYLVNADGFPIETRNYSWNMTTSLWVQGNTYTKQTYNPNRQLTKTETFNSASFSTGYTNYTHDTKGNANEYKEYKRKPDNSFYLSYQYNATFDDKKIIQNFSFYNDFFQVNNTIDAIAKEFATDGSVSNQSSATYSYEYNEAGYVTKVFYNGVLSTTYMLEKVN